MSDVNGANSFPQSDAMLQLAYCRALELADFRGGFLARTAHELRSPLNKVITLQQMILEGLCDSTEEEREFVAEAYAASIKLLEYLDFLIRVSKIEVGRLKPDLQVVSLAKTFDEVKDGSHLQAADRNLRLLFDRPDESLYVRVDPHWLQNLLMTLIDIALNIGDRGTIRLRIAPESPADTCYLWLEDDRSATYWQESIALPIIGDFDLDDSLSVSLRMGMVEAMLKAMGGTLSLLTISEGDTPTRLQLALPVQTSN